MTWLELIKSAHTGVTDAVSHAKRLRSKRYFVWQEDGASDLAANNAHVERSVTGTTDLFTPLEHDPWADALGESFSNHGVAWALNSVQYEEQTGLWHIEWRWTVGYGYFNPHNN